VADGVLADDRGDRVRPADLDVVWWRRNGVPVVPEAVRDEDARRVVAGDAHAAAVGLFATAFSGAWVSDPDATWRAENKLVQLTAARRVGLRLPRTLVSQDPDDIRAFTAEIGGPVVVKTVAGALGVPLAAGLVDAATLADSRALALSPAIYQECVPGSRHLRVCCFGERIHAVTLESPTLDWRYVRGLDARPCELDPEVGEQLVAVLDLLGLRMGMFDLKPTDEGPPIWLEVNPQGQFLFLEGLCGLPLGRIAADFLIAEADRGRRTSGRVRGPGTAAAPRM
jgi:glutathione synthase/RimK-type ligase-like ATP-grasp enzyme